MGDIRTSDDHYGCCDEMYRIPYLWLYMYRYPQRPGELSIIYKGITGWFVKYLGHFSGWCYIETNTFLSSGISLGCLWSIQIIIYRNSVRPDFLDGALTLTERSKMQYRVTPFGPIKLHSFSCLTILFIDQHHLPLLQTFSKTNYKKAREPPSFTHKMVYCK